MQEEGGIGLAPDLQEQIEGTLEELAARCVLELLSLPLDKEHEPRRQQGLQGLRTLLWNVDEGGRCAPTGGFTHEQFLKEAFSLMTASEQVCYRLPPGLLYGFCLFLHSLWKHSHVLHAHCLGTPTFESDSGPLYLKGMAVTIHCSLSSRLMDSPI